jgi:hypothetical protein
MNPEQTMRLELVKALLAAGVDADLCADAAGEIRGIHPTSYPDAASQHW